MRGICDIWFSSGFQVAKRDISFSAVESGMNFGFDLCLRTKSEGLAWRKNWGHAKVASRNTCKIEYVYIYI